MHDSGVSWMHSTQLRTGGTDIHLSSANNFSFLHQLKNELAHDTISDYITHTMHTYDSIIILAFLLRIEQRMYGRVIFDLSQKHLFGSNSAAIRALELHSLLCYSFTLYYLALE